MIFDYPAVRLSRRHGPQGYQSYDSYRPWLRDEFSFRCIYCLKREVWGQVTGEFELDHFAPQSINPELKYDYFNLVYACRRCNSIKLDQLIAAPMQTLQAETISVLPDDSLESNDMEADRLIRQLDLNSPRLKKWRVMWIRIIELAKENDQQLYSHLAGFPYELPNLGRLRPPDNSRPQGVEESWFAQREAGQLPDVY